MLQLQQRAAAVVFIFYAAFLLRQRIDHPYLLRLRHRRLTDGALLVFIIVVIACFYKSAGAVVVFFNGQCDLPGGNSPR